MDDDIPLEFELHGYVDGVIDDDVAARVEAHLRKHPEVAEKVRDYMAQRDHIRLFARSGAATAPADAIDKLEAQLARRLKRGAILRWPRMAVMAALFLAGWLAHTLYVPLMEGPPYTDEIVRAHVLASDAPEEIIPISADRVARLFARLGEMARLPDLRVFGYEPIGAQLLPSDEGIVLHVPYRDASGTILSYFLLHSEDEAELPQHILHRQGVTMAYWQHDHSRYALAASLADEEVRELAAFLEAAQEPL